MLGLILMTVGIGAVVSFLQARSELDEHAGERALAVARVVATDADVVEAFSTPEPPAIIDPIAEHFREAAGAAFIVVADDRGIRFSHPNPQMIGTSLLDDPGENPQAVLSGKTFVGVQNGSLGPSMRAKTPIRNADGKVIGLVSVGISEQKISETLRAHLLIYLLPAILGLGLGVVGAVLLSRRVKRQTFGLEPGEIAGLLEQREAMLHGVREGAVTVDTADRITMINDEAQRLLGVDRDDRRPAAVRPSCPPAASRRCSPARRRAWTRSSSCATACSSSTACPSSCADGPSAPSSRSATAPSWTPSPASCRTSAASPTRCARRSTSSATGCT